LSPNDDNGILSPFDDRGAVLTIRNAEELGAAIRRRRHELLLDQQTLAQRAQVSRQWIVEIEQGKERAEIGLLLRTLKVLGLGLEIISGEISSPPPPVVRRRYGRGRLDLDVDIDAAVERARGRRQ
jgi:HTH-type transcriptional regulator/antitoxin HipB